MSRFIRFTLQNTYILLLALGFSSANAQTPVLWGNLESGSYAVGFKFIYQQDYSRVWKATEDSNGYPQATGRGRPVRISVWYPAKRQANNPRMLYRDYLHATAQSAAFAELNRLLEQRDVGNFRANLKAGEFDALMKTKTAAVQNAVPQKGAFPLLVYSAGLNNSSQDNVVLCEYLASHGYVVITVPQLGATSLDVNLKFPSPADLETQILDLQFAVGAMRDFPDADRSNLGAIGYSVGGVAALNLVMRNYDFDALVTLDPTFGVAPYIKLATESIHYHPTKMRVSWLYLYRTEPATNLAVFDALKYSNRYRLEMAGMFHQDFSSFPMFASQSAVTQTRTPETAKRGYQAMCRYILNFFNAHLKKDKRGLELIALSPQENGFVENISKFEVRAAMQVPPTEEKFLKVLEQEGFEQAVKLYNEYRAKDPQEPIFRESFLNDLGYKLKNENRLAQAIEIFKLNVEAYPSSANVYDSLGEAHMANGNKELAVKFYEKAIELNPNNRGAVEALRKLKSSP
ncbi:MAG TPA: tetratricopeptide repeat protein [Pyrinomonadaceae bacterium]|jgi:dienelactone hydrolase